MRARLRGLYAIAPEQSDTAALVAGVQRALAGGAALVQYRSKIADAALRREQALALLGACRRAGVPLVVNDDPALAAAIGADGVHLGRDDGDPRRARALLGRERILGVSCYDEWERAREAAAAGADYLAFGSVFASPTKPQAVRAPLDLLTRARRELELPVAAIGGITLDNAARLIEAGADLLAVLSDLFDAPDIEARAAGYARLFAG